METGEDQAGVLLWWRGRTSMNKPFAGGEWRSMCVEDLGLGPVLAAFAADDAAFEADGANPREPGAGNRPPCGGSWR